MPAPRGGYVNTVNATEIYVCLVVRHVNTCFCRENRTKIPSNVYTSKTPIEFTTYHGISSQRNQADVKIFVPRSVKVPYNGGIKYVANGCYQKGK